tara:strand:- start:44 stop:1345 length:1302 start_codon:yes stop_codon:yes gene_type:complete
MPVDTLVRTGIKEVTQRVAQKGTKIAATGNWTGSLKKLNPETLRRLPDELHPTQLEQLKELSTVNPDAAEEVLFDLQRGIQDGEWDNARGKLANLDKLHSQDFSKAQTEQAIPEKEFTQAEASPTRYDVEGVEGRRSVEQAARPWFDEQLDRIGWDPKRTGEIDRSQFANEGIYVDGEKFNFSGLTQYARDRKSFPKLRPAQRSASKLDRASNELVQTFGPAIRAKPQLVDIMGEVVPEKDVHKHHVLLLKVLEPWTRKADGSIRDRKQLKQLFTALSKRDWWAGNVDKNLVWQSVATHFGDPSSSHGLLKTFTDIQGRGVSESKELAAQTGKTYDPKAMHGFSNEFIRDLSKETNTKKLIQSLLMFLEEGGGGEAMEGAAYSAQKNLEPRAKIKGKDVVSGDILHDRRLQNPRVKKNVERFEKATSKLKKDK